MHLLELLVPALANPKRFVAELWAEWLVPGMRAVVQQYQELLQESSIVFGLEWSPRFLQRVVRRVSFLR